MDAAELRGEIAEIRALMMITVKAHARSLEERLKNSGHPISPMQYGILRQLSHHSHTSSDISKLMVLDPSTLVPAVEDLERKGLVLRTRDPNDRRRAPLTMTDEGRQTLEGLQDIHDDDALYNGLVALGAERVEELVGLLRALVANLPEGESQACAIRERLYGPDQSQRHGPSDPQTYSQQYAPHLRTRKEQ